MASEDDFITRLMGFGLTEKEAQLYVYLLKHGPHTLSVLAKPLYTYREDVRRTLASLIDKGMVCPSLDSPATYTAVELEIARESALKKYQAELREMDTRKRAMEELAHRQQLRLSNDMPTLNAQTTQKEGAAPVMSTGVVINSIEDAVAVILKIFESSKREIVFVTSPSLLSIAGTYNSVYKAKRFIQDGGTLRGITTITHTNAEEARMHMDVGLNLRHSDQFHELSLFVGDEQYSISGINTGVDKYTLDTPVKGFWSEDPAYAEFLLALFENVWSHAVPAKERIKELSEHGTK